MKTVTLTPISYVENVRREIKDDQWGCVQSTIRLVEDMPSEALLGLESFSHVEVIFYFDQVPEQKIVKGARHPRNRQDWPLTGILAQRGKNRPNRLGATIASVVGVDGECLIVEGLDAIDKTPILDIKPVMKEFLPQTPVSQPAWVSELMAHYW